NDYFEIFNIDQYPNNKVSIYNRWGDKVFEVMGYDNDQKVFKGENNITGSGKLSSGVYFYRILLGDGTQELNGYLELKAGPR
ncbi:MAG TPA: gliding motility-associated C-terminal domain-containing protein, partial [Cyclobacteriaceae bacterium]|nr:gliding motility-associated C-terminal domain-containing protein [Cyclobacteriaceae bacterium]